MVFLKRTVFLLAVSSFFLGSCAFGAEQGAIAAARSARAKMDASTEKMEGAMAGSDLKAIASPKKPVTATGFPAGTLPGGGASGGTPSGEEAAAPGRVVLSGDPLEPLVGASHLGSSLDRIWAMADHAGYGLVLRGRYAPSALDAPYSYSLMRGRRRIATLFFDRSLKLSGIQ